MTSAFGQTDGGGVDAGGGGAAVGEGARVGREAGEEGGGDLVVDGELVGLEKAEDEFAGGASGDVDQIDGAVARIGGVVIKDDDRRLVGDVGVIGLDAGTDGVTRVKGHDEIVGVSEDGDVFGDQVDVIEKAEVVGDGFDTKGGDVFVLREEPGQHGGSGTDRVAVGFAIGNKQDAGGLVDEGEDGLEIEGWHGNRAP